MTEADGSQQVGTQWGNRCPRCNHIEKRDYGPGHRTGPKRCPECDWPMHCVDLDLVDGEPEGGHAA